MVDFMLINVFWQLCVLLLRIELFILLCLFVGKLLKTKLQQHFNI